MANEAESGASVEQTDKRNRDIVISQPALHHLSSGPSGIYIPFSLIDRFYAEISIKIWNASRVWGLLRQTALRVYYFLFSGQGSLWGACPASDNKKAIQFF